VSKKLVEIRDKFSKVLNDPSHLNATSRDIASGFFRSHRTSFSQEEWDEVTLIGLIHVMDGLRRRRAPQTSSDQGLFIGFDVEPIVVVRVVEDGKGPIEKKQGNAFSHALRGNGLLGAAH
jgi:hypothetical protein